MPAFFKDGLQMITSLCDYSAKYSCSTINPSDVIDAANDCARAYHGVKERILSDYRGDDSTKYKECVLPEKTYTDERGTKVWSICCVRHMAQTNDCRMICTRFIDPKSVVK